MKISSDEIPAGENPADEGPDGAGERIAKRLARAGLCSRRDAERWVAEGRIQLNGQTLTSPAVVVRPGDQIVVDGKPLPEPEPTRLWRYHKPAGLVTTARDEKGRTTVFDRLPADIPRVVSVGRLDLTTEGLLLLTNDGELARFLELPSTGWTRRYRVRVHGAVDEARLAQLAKGMTIEGVRYGAIEAELDRVQGSNAWLTIALREGKNREIRKVMEALGLQVNRLIRTAYGPFQLGKLEEAAIEEVPRRVVRDQLARFFGDAAAEPAAGGTAKAKPKPPPRPHTPRPSDARMEAAAKARPPKPRAATSRAAPKPSHGPKFPTAMPRGADPESDRPETAAAPETARARPAKPHGFRSEGTRPEGGKPARARSEGARPEGGKPYGVRPDGGKPARARPEGAKPEGGKPTRARSEGARPEGGKPARARPEGGKPYGVRPEGGKPARARPEGAKPGPAKREGGAPPGGKPRGAKPGPASPRPPAKGGPRADRRR